MQIKFIKEWSLKWEQKRWINKQKEWIYIPPPSRFLPALFVDEVVLLPAPTLLSEIFLHFLFLNLLSTFPACAISPSYAVSAFRLRATFWVLQFHRSVLANSQYELYCHYQSSCLIRQCAPEVWLLPPLTLKTLFWCFGRQWHDHQLRHISHWGTGKWFWVFRVRYLAPGFASASDVVAGREASLIQLLKWRYWQR